jgi:hypothetical protein
MKSKFVVLQGVPGRRAFLAMHLGSTRVTSAAVPFGTLLGGRCLLPR